MKWATKKLGWNTSCVDKPLVCVFKCVFKPTFVCSGPNWCMICMILFIYVMFLSLFFFHTEQNSSEPKRTLTPLIGQMCLGWEWECKNRNKVLKKILLVQLSSRQRKTPIENSLRDFITQCVFPYDCVHVYLPYYTVIACLAVLVCLILNTQIHVFVHVYMFCDTWQRSSFWEMSLALGGGGGSLCGNRV